jgi:hypothetical protein
MQRSSNLPSAVQLACWWSASAFKPVALKPLYEIMCCAGSIPPGLVNAFVNGSVHGLDLSYNSLSGTLPAEITTTSAFHTLNLASNFLTGTVPASWAQIIANSQAFDGSNLMLSGQLPEATSSVYATSFGT